MLWRIVTQKRIGIIVNSENAHTHNFKHNVTRPFHVQRNLNTTAIH